MPAFGDLDQVGLAEIETYKANKLTAGLAKKTINNHLTVLRKLPLQGACGGPERKWLQSAARDRR